MYEYDWSPEKCLAVSAAWAVPIILVLLCLTLMWNTESSHADKRLKECVAAGGSWVVDNGDRNCVLPGDTRGR